MQRNHGVISLKLKKNKLLFFFLFSLLLIGIIGVSAGLNPFEAPEDAIYIKPNDLIKNFRFDTFDESIITQSGVTAKYGDKLKFEMADSWTASKSDLEILQSYILEDTVYLQYLLTAKRKINIYTNVRLDDASQKSLSPVTESLRVGSFEYQGCFGDTFYSWTSDLNWTHYDFGDVWAYNMENNKFSGTLTMDFDIAQSPLPAIFTDSEGNSLIKNFDYISIYSAGISDQEIGKLSNTMPTLTGLTPAEYEAKKDTRTGGSAGGGMEGFEYTWNPNFKIEHLTLNTFDPGIQPQTKGSSLNPTTKAGNQPWSAEDTEQSMTDAKLYYHIGSLSPYIVEYGSRLTYDQQEIVVKDEPTVWFFFVPVAWEPKLQYDNEKTITETRPTGLHVTNRFIQTEIQVTFEFWSSYTYELLEIDPIELEDPEEYYDEIIWNTIVDGAGGGKTYVSSWAGFFTLGTIILLVIIGVIGIAAIIILYRFYRKKAQLAMKIL